MQIPATDMRAQAMTGALIAPPHLRGVIPREKCHDELRSQRRDWVSMQRRAGWSAAKIAAALSVPVTTVNFIIFQQIDAARQENLSKASLISPPAAPQETAQGVRWETVVRTAEGGRIKHIIRAHDEAGVRRRVSKTYPKGGEVVSVTRFCQSEDHK